MRLFRPKLNLKRCLVPDGYFTMGAKEESFDEGPVHRVYLAAFEMSQYPVTNADYALFLRGSGAEPPRWFNHPAFSDPRQPVVGVSWHDARAYCQWLSAESGLDLRLPTEAEYEKAARDGRQGAHYPWGNERAHSGYSLERGPLPAPYRSGVNPANGYGLYDTVSNVYQWCLDAYDPNYYAVSPEKNPLATSAAGLRSARGASWKQDDLLGRCAARASLAPYFKVDDFGLRWVVGHRIELAAD